MCQTARSAVKSGALFYLAYFSGLALQVGCDRRSMPGSSEKSAQLLCGAL